jgi:uncharacterized protein YndB with AHSA1/START domain
MPKSDHSGAVVEKTSTAKAGKLEVTLPNDREVVVSRVFKAPPSLVFDAFTQPAIVARWLGGMPGWTMPVCEMDVRVGGKFAWRWRNEDGKEMGFTGEFREVVKPSRLVHTENYDPGDFGGSMGGEALVISEFKPLGKGTLYTVTIRYRSKADRDAAVATGMTDGMEISYARLEAILTDADA